MMLRRLYLYKRLGSCARPLLVLLFLSLCHIFPFFGQEVARGYNVLSTSIIVYVGGKKNKGPMRDWKTERKDK